MKGKNLLNIIIMCLAMRTHAVEDCKPKEGQNIDDYYACESLITKPLVYRDFRPWRYPFTPRILESTVKTEKDNFLLTEDVLHFDPSDITVKVENGYVVVDAKHEEKKEGDEYYISREIVRRYPLPDNVKSEDIVAEVSSDGILAISAPRLVFEGVKDRVISLTFTGMKRLVPKEKEVEEA